MKEKNLQPLVFISYSHVDKGFARRLSKRLIQIGVNCFLDEKNIEWGDPITDKVRESLNQCTAIIVILSPASLKSAWVPFEVGQAVSAGKRVLPLLTHPSLDVPLYLADLNCIKQISDAVKFFDSESWGQHVASLAAVPQDAQKIASSIQPNYGALVTSVFKLVHIFVSYSSDPPSATYDEYAQGEAAVRDWLFDNKLQCNIGVYEQCEKYLLKIRGYIILGVNLRALFGGDGRPSEEKLTKQEKELLKDAKSIEQNVRSILK